MRHTAVPSRPVSVSWRGRMPGLWVREVPTEPQSGPELGEGRCDSSGNTLFPFPCCVRLEGASGTQSRGSHRHSRCRGCPVAAPTPRVEQGGRGTLRWLWRVGGWARGQGWAATARTFKRLGAPRSPSWPPGRKWFVALPQIRGPPTTRSPHSQDGGEHLPGVRQGFPASLAHRVAV